MPHEGWCAIYDPDGEFVGCSCGGRSAPRVTPESPGQKTVEEWSGGPVREATDGSAPRGTLGDLVYHIDALVKRERAKALKEMAAKFDGQSANFTRVNEGRRLTPAQYHCTGIWKDAAQRLRARAAEEET